MTVKTDEELKAQEATLLQDVIDLNNKIIQHADKVIHFLNDRVLNLEEKNKTLKEQSNRLNITVENLLKTINNKEPVKDDDYKYFRRLPEDVILHAQQLEKERGYAPVISIEEETRTFESYDKKDYITVQSVYKISS